MARVAITEYAAKKLVLGEDYKGVSVTPESASEVVASLPESGVFIVKIDVGIKKRGKQGLIRVKIPKSDLHQSLFELFALGHDRCIVEEIVPHESFEERYVSIDLQREGAQILYAKEGGVDIEAHPEAIQRFFVPRREVLAGKTTLTIADVSLSLLLSKMQEFHMSFMEINPFISHNGAFTALDMAVELDDARLRKLPLWIYEHCIDSAPSAAERAVKTQSEMTSAALTLKMLNPNGSLLTLLSGGGASLVAMDSLVSAGLQEKTINYSEYSGAPTRDETRVYVSTLLTLLFASPAPQKAILIAGGVANFTDVKLTFEGIIDAFSEHIDTLKAQNVFVCVRRGGPNQEKGIDLMRSFLSSHAIAHEVYGPEFSLGAVGSVVSKHV